MITRRPRPALLLVALIASVASCSGPRLAPDGAATATQSSPLPESPLAPTKSPDSPTRERAPIRMVAIGESWTSGQGDETTPPGYVGIVARRLADARPGSTYENFGCAGWSAPQLVREGCDGHPPPIERVASVRPTHVTVLIGANDIADWRWDDGDVLGDFVFSRYEESLERAHAQIAATGARIIQLEVPDLTRFPVARTWTDRKKRTIRERVTEVNSAIRRMVAARNGTVVPLHSVERLYAPENFVGDGLHLNHRGYEVVADALWSIVSREVNP